jgi:protein-tyrosine phosphatase
MSFKILFVCMGNICRSPAAECIFQQLLNKNGLEGKFTCDSAGTIDMHAGNPPDHRMQKALRTRNIPVFGSARQVQVEDFEKFDLVLAMDESNLSNLRSLDPNGRYAEKIRLFGDYCKSDSGIEIPDPYYGGQSGFDTVIDLLEDGCENLINQLQQSYG